MAETAEDFKKERTAAAACLRTRMMNLNALTGASEATALDKVWSDVREQMTLIEDKHNKYYLAIMAENDDELPADGAKSEKTLDKWYNDQMAKMRGAEQEFKKRRFVGVERQLDVAKEAMVAEAAHTLNQADKGLEAINAAALLLESTYANLKPLIDDAVSFVPAGKEAEMSDGIKNTMSRYHEAKRMQSDVKV